MKEQRVSIPTDRPVIRDHPKKISIESVAPGRVEQPEAGRPGWIDMDVRWLVTRQTVGSEDSVFGVTYFPPGARHEIHRHENAEEVEYLIAGEGVARIGEDDVAMAIGDAVFVPRNDYHGFRNTSDTDTAIMVWCYAGAASLDEAGYITEEQDGKSP
jgi:oxalate decarboxylase/phosphoglucose isomerase-like protein (cupin superfamily)